MKNTGKATACATSSKSLIGEIGTLPRVLSDEEKVLLNLPTQKPNGEKTIYYGCEDKEKLKNFASQNGDHRLQKKCKRFSKGMAIWTYQPSASTKAAQLALRTSNGIY